MLSEADFSTTRIGDEGRSIKKRRVKGRIVTNGPEDVANTGPGSTIQKNPLRPTEVSKATSDTDGLSTAAGGSVIQQQTAYNDESDENSEDDFVWEEVDLSHNPEQQEVEGGEEKQEQDLNLILRGNDDQMSSKSVMRRRPVTAAERKLRLEIHKMHLLCLLFHAHVRNHWCNDEEVQV